MFKHEYILSIDCGIRNSAISLLKVSGLDFIVVDVWILGIDGKQKTKLLDLKEMATKGFELKELLYKDYGANKNNMFFLIEQQPMVNRNTCMVHDMFCTIFYDHDQFSIHPTKKNMIQCDFEITEKGKPQKAFTKQIASKYLQDIPKYQSMKKKDDIADTICQAIYYLRHE